MIRLLGEHPLTSPGLTGDWEHRLAKIEQGDETARAFMDDIAKFAAETVSELDEAQGRADPARQPRARARSAATTSSRTARATRAGRARTPAAAS